MKKCQLEKAKMDEVNTDLKTDFDKAREELKVAEQKLEEAKTASVSDPTIHMTRLVTHNLARNSMIVSSPERLALDIAIKTGNIKSEALVEKQQEVTKKACKEEAKKQIEESAEMIRLLPVEDKEPETAQSLESEIKATLNLAEEVKEDNDLSPIGSPIDSLPIFLDYKYKRKGKTGFAAITLETILDVSVLNIDAANVKQKLLDIENSISSLELVFNKNRAEIGIFTDSPILSSVNICNLSLHKTKTINTFFAGEEINIIAMATPEKRKLSKEELKGETALSTSREDSFKANSFSGSFHDSSRRKLATSFDPMKSFFILVIHFVQYNRRHNP